MTRINVVPVEELTRQHLVAEYREIMRLPSNLKMSLNSKRGFDMSDIPQSYTLGTGHVKFFYDKMKFLQKRFEQLTAEMMRRGYSPNFLDSAIFIPLDKKFYNDWEPTEEAKTINRARIQDRLRAKRPVKALKQEKA